MSDENVTAETGGSLATMVAARPPTSAEKRSTKVPERQTAAHSGATTEKLPLNLCTAKVTPAIVNVDARFVESEENVNVASVIVGGTRGPASAVIDTGMVGSRVNRSGAIAVVEKSKFVGGFTPFCAKIKPSRRTLASRAQRAHPYRKRGCRNFFNICFVPTKEFDGTNANLNQKNG